MSKDTYTAGQEQLISCQYNHKKTLHNNANHAHVDIVYDTLVSIMLNC